MTSIRMRAAVLVLAASFMTGGCLSSVALVKVRPDASGTIELTTAVRQAALAVEPELLILQTNTPHRSGQHVTLRAIDAERVLLEEETWKRLRLRPASLDELRFELHDAPGVTVGLDREIRIEPASR